MNICEAVKKAYASKKCIERTEAFGHWKIRPTNTPECCYLIVDSKSSHKGWQPQAEDLQAEDWEVVD